MINTNDTITVDESNVQGSAIGRAEASVKVKLSRYMPELALGDPAG